MNDDYLWDRSGPPDTAIQKLEQSLSPLGAIAPLRKSEPRWKPALALAAGLFIIWGALYAIRPIHQSDWKREGGAALSTGATVKTGGDSRLTLTADSTGQIDLAPNSELHLPVKNDRQQLSLVRGEMHALIWAPPGKFVVDTPSSKTVDLGCEYKLKVEPDGSGLLTVETGWVALQAGAHESFIPAGAACRTTRASGPWLPYYVDSSAEFQAALRRYGHEQSESAVRDVLSLARPKDAFTIWHLLNRVNDDVAGIVVSRFVELTPAARAVNRSLLAKRQPQALDAAWNTLDLGEMSFWREWKRSWK